MSESMLTDLTRLVLERFFGKYRGTVTDNADSEQRGRLKVQVPAVLGEAAVWALPCVPYAGDAVGFVALPEPGTQVWVEFEAGDVSFPIWTGCFWRSGEMPGDGTAARKLWVTAKGSITIDDEAGSIVIETAGGARVTVSDAVLAEAGASVEVATGGVTAASGSGGSVEISGLKVSVNGGALEVT